MRHESKRLKLSKKQERRVEAAMEVDRAWFAFHPGEAIYHHDAIPGELGSGDLPLNLPWRVKVTLLGKGLRTRQFYLEGNPGNPEIMLLPFSLDELKDDLQN